MRCQGRVKFFNYAKGYGFITPNEGVHDIFVHISTVHRAGIPHLLEGTCLSFDLLDDEQGRGPQATELQLL